MKRSSIALLALFITYLLVIIFFSNVVPFDSSLVLKIQSIRTPTADTIISLLGEIGSLAFFVLVIIFLWFKKEKKASVYLAISLIIDGILILILKTIIARPRPFQALNIRPLHLAMGSSMPSGHAERAFLSATILSNFYKRFQILFYALAIFISFTRIYTGNHYPLDIIIGAMNGVSIALILLNTEILSSAYKAAKNIYK